MKSTVLLLLLSLGQTPPVGVVPSALSAPEALQAVIDRGDELVYVPVGEYVVTEPIRLRSNIRLVFEPGVTLRAAEGAFKGKEDSLLRIHQASNVQVEGNGLVIVMRKHDYMNHPDYTVIDSQGRRVSNSQWRHGIDVRGASNITISDVVIRETGGDGICIGPTHQSGELPVPDRIHSTGIVLRNIRTEKAFRNGFSFTSAEVVAYDCAAIGSQGTSPQAGYDAEPNDPRDLNFVRLVRCTATGNVGPAWLAGWGRSKADHPPRRVVLEDCTSTGFPWRMVGVWNPVAPEGFPHANLAKGSLLSVDGHVLLKVD